jgi:hypothetical protein
VHWAPGIPHALTGGGFKHDPGASRRGIADVCFDVIARSEATKQSTLPSLLHGLLRGPCHRARIRATRWLAMTVAPLSHSVIARESGCEINLRPHPEERALARVSKDGRESMRWVHPSRRLLRKLLRMRIVLLHRLDHVTQAVTSNPAIRIVSDPS